MATRSFLLTAAAAAAVGCDRAEPPPPPPAPVAPAPAIIGHAGPNVIDPDGSWIPLAGTTRAAFARDHATVLPAAVPAAGPGDAQLGTLWTGAGSDQASWMLTGDPQHGYAFRLDADLDGDLTDDPSYPLAQTAPGDWTAAIATTIPDRVTHARAAVVFGVALHAGELAAVTSTQRRGVLDVGGRRVAFAVDGLMGRYGADKQAIAFDLDGDGSADADPDSAEAYLTRDRRVVLGGAAYDFAVAADGATVTLTPAPPGTPVVARPSLAVGSLAPELPGAPELAGRRGQVVVLDFWARWCAPCVAGIPALVALVAAHRADRLALVSVVIEDDPDALRAFAAAHAMTWPQLPEPSGGPIQSLYRVSAVPELFVIGRDGRLACARCEPAELAGVVATALAAPE